MKFIINTTLKRTNLKIKITVLQAVKLCLVIFEVSEEPALPILKMSALSSSVNTQQTTKHAIPYNGQVQKYYHSRQATSNKLNKSTHTVNINSPRNLLLVFFCFCVSTKNATRFIS